MAMQKITDLQLLELVLASPGVTDSELGEKLGLSRVQISRRRNDFGFKKILGEHYQESFTTLKAAHIKAIRRICLAMDNEDDRIAIKAAELVLEMSKGNSITSNDSKEQQERDSHLAVLKSVQKILEETDSHEKNQ